MATNKTITVITPSVVSNDTLDSYNVYSSVDGLLANITPAEASAGYVISLTDDAIHNVYARPVGIINGEFGNATSNLIIEDTNPAGDTEAPVVGVISLGAVTEDEQVLNWTAATDNVGVTGYDIYKDNVLLANVGNVLTYTATGLSLVTSYDYKIKAKDAAGNISGFSNTVTGSTVDSTAPSAPVITELSKTTTTVEFSRTNATDNVGVTGYNWYKDGSIGATNTMVNPKTYSGLSPDTEYTFTCRALDAAGNESVDSNTVVVTTASAVDTEAPVIGTLSFGTITGTTIVLDWTAATDNVGVTSYDIYRNAGGAGYGYHATVGAVLTYTDLGLDDAVEYKYVIKAKDLENNESDYSNEVVTTTPDITDPSVPTLSVGTITETTIELNWTSATDNVGVYSYNLWYTYNDVDWNAFGEIFSPTLTKVHTGLTADTYVRYSVRSKDAAGNNSDWSNEVTATTIDETAPSVPTLTEVSHDDTSVTLNRTTSTDNVAVDQYIWYRDMVQWSNGNATTKTNSGLDPETQYSYTVTAIDAAGNESAHSNAVVVTTDAEIDTEAPVAGTLSLGTTGVTTQVLNWTAATDNVGVAAYEIFKDGDYFATAGLVLTYTVTGLTADTEYDWEVKIWDDGYLNSSYTNLVTATTNAAVTIVGEEYPQDNAASVADTNAVGTAFGYNGSCSVVSSGAESAGGSYSLLIVPTLTGSGRFRGHQVTGLEQGVEHTLSFNAKLGGTTSEAGCRTWWGVETSPNVVIDSVDEFENYVCTFTPNSDTVTMNFLPQNNNNAALTDELYIDNMSITPHKLAYYELGAGEAGQNAEEDMITGETYISSGDLELGFDNPWAQELGLIFNTAVPQGATIIEAYVQFQRNTTGSSAEVITKWDGMAVDTPVTYTSQGAGSFQVRDTARTTAFINQSWDSWQDDHSNTHGLKQRSVDLKTIVQEIVDRPTHGGTKIGLVCGHTAGTANRNADRGHNGHLSLQIRYLDAAPLMEFDVTNTVASANTLTNVIGGDWTVVRNSEGSYIDNADLFKIAAANVPRIDYSDGGNPQVRIEPQFENTIDDNQTEENGVIAWHCDFLGNHVTSPDGTVNGLESYCNQTDSENYHTDYRQWTIGEDMVFGAWLRADTPMDINMGIYGRNVSEGDSRICSLTTDWQWFEFTWTCTFSDAEGGWAYVGTAAGYSALPALSVRTIHIYRANFGVATTVGSAVVSYGTGTGYVREADVITNTVPVGGTNMETFIDGVSDGGVAVTAGNTITMVDGTTKIIIT